MRIFFLFSVFSGIFFFSCGEKKTPQDVPSGDTLHTAYSKGFDLIAHDGYTAAIVYNPWKEGEVYARYYLIKDSAVQTPSDGIRISIPLRTLAVNSATYFESLDLIGELKSIKGTCNADYVYNAKIVQGTREGRIADLGDSYNLNIEKLMLLRPSAIMATAYNTQDENSKRLAQCGIPVIYNIEWQEVTPLGRAEWIRFIAAFYDKLPQADSVFTGIAQRYGQLKEKVRKNPDKRAPSLLTGQDYRGSWNMPAGESFNANLYRDAGASYYYSDKKGKGSITTSIEEALIHFSNADIWVGVSGNTYKELVAMNPKYELFKAYREKQVYNFNKRSTPSGGNDYWEGAVVHADLLLSDFVKLLHPSLLPEYEMTYTQALQAE